MKNYKEEKQPITLEIPEGVNRITIIDGKVYAFYAPFHPDFSVKDQVIVTDIQKLFPYPCHSRHARIIKKFSVDNTPHEVIGTNFITKINY